MGIHGDLNDSQRKDFLRRGQTALISKYPNADIVECTRQHKRLTDILIALSGMKRKPPSVQNPSKIRPIGAGKRSSVRHSKTRKYKPQSCAYCGKSHSNQRLAQDCARQHNPEQKGTRYDQRHTKDNSKDRSRGGKSNLSGSVWSPPVNRDEAIHATVNFDVINRPDYL